MTDRPALDDPVSSLRASLPQPGPSAREQAAELFGEPGVNSAGINLRPPMGKLGEETWDTTMAVTP